jgi:hypothetical protein
MGLSGFDTGFSVSVATLPETRAFLPCRRNQRSVGSSAPRQSSAKASLSDVNDREVKSTE